MTNNAQSVTKISLAQATTRLNANSLSFASTAALKPFDGVLGQDRAVNAIQFGVAMNRPGYNIYVMGESGTGRSSYIKDYLRQDAQAMPAPSDWCYVNNFNNPREPYAIELPAGEAQGFKDIFEKFIDNLLATFPAAFESPNYQQLKSNIDHAFNRKYDKAIEIIEREALKHDIALYRDTSTISFTPMANGKALDEAEFSQLSEEQRDAFHHNIAELEHGLNEALSELPQWKRETYNALKDLNLETTNQEVTPWLKQIQEQFQEYPQVVTYLESLQEFLPRLIQEDLIDDRVLESRDEHGKRGSLEEALLPNIAVSNACQDGAPVVYEPHPSYANLFGRIEFSNDQGALVTNYRKVAAGALHKANGGYLVLDAEKMLAEPMVWDALKRAVKSGELKMENPYSEFGLVSTTTLLPETISIQVKLVLIGSRNVYYLLQEYDEDFDDLFRVLVDFDGEIPRTDEHILAFSRLLKSRIDEQNYADISSQGVARLIEYSSRLAADQKYLSAKIGELFELLAEADCLRVIEEKNSEEKNSKSIPDKNTPTLIEQRHIEQALSAKEQRTGRIYDKLHQQMMDDVVLIETDGKAVGKINGLTVMSIGDTSFGSPARISATVYPGSRGVVDIEREVSLGRAIHSKGVMILSGYLGHRYAQDFPLAISAHLAMEQSYGQIDGDSASMAELCCFVSALIQQPLDQGFAITGSMNQYGEVQAIGGVNEKIEGFFRLCNERGLTGHQGVIIPKANVRNLALKQEVLEAIEANKFTIHAVEHVDQAISILMQREVGEVCQEHYFSQGSINYDIVMRLKNIADCAKEKKSDEQN